jgi:cell division protein ZapA
VSNEPVAVSIVILDKEYTVACPPEEKEGLEEAARTLNARMRQVRDSGKVMGAERMAVMTALNVIHECNRERTTHTRAVEQADAAIRSLEERVKGAVPRREPVRPVD